MNNYLFSFMGAIAGIGSLFLPWFSTKMRHSLETTGGWDLNNSQLLIIAFGLLVVVSVAGFFTRRSHKEGNFFLPVLLLTGAFLAGGVGYKGYLAVMATSRKLAAVSVEWEKGVYLFLGALALVLIDAILGFITAMGEHQKRWEAVHRKRPRGRS